MPPYCPRRGPDYDDWVTQEFSESLPVEHTAPDAEPDGDGLVNLAEYAFLRVPEKSDHADPVLTGARKAGGRPVLYYQRRSDDPAIAVVVETTADLHAWNVVSAADVDEHIHARIGNVVESVRATYVDRSGNAHFFRLSVIASP